MIQLTSVEYLSLVRRASERNRFEVAILEHNANALEVCSETCPDWSPKHKCTICPRRHTIELPERAP